MRRTIKGFFFIFIFAALAAACGKGGMMVQPELYAVKYGTSLYPGASVYDGYKKDVLLPFAWLFYVVKSGDRIILVDTGFSDAATARVYHITLEDIASYLGKIGVSGDTVTDIIITHAHFDHAGGIVQYPRARVFANEYERIRLRQFCPDESRITFFSGSYRLNDHILIEHVGGHTKGSCVVWIDTPDKKILLTGDEAYLPRNLSTVTPVGSWYNREANRAFLEKIAKEKITAYTFHDPAVVLKGEVVRKLYP
jgi:glyoxylase-like metal-dependent hydrolase (beta-lactamase superfamily II)